MQSRGVLYMTLSALGFSAMSVLVKIASPTIPTGELVFARALVTLVISYWLVKRAALLPWGPVGLRGKLVVRGLLGTGALACYYLALAHLPLADATTLHYMQPLITAVLAWRILGERIGWAAAFAIGCGIGGVLLVVHPGVPLGTGADPFGVAVAVASATLSSIAYVTVRQLAGAKEGSTLRAHALVIVFYFPLVAAPLSLPWLLYDFVWPTPIEWLLLLGIGVTTQLGQVFLTMALTIESASRATSVGYIQICFAMVWQLVVFDKAPALGTIAGAALVIVGTLAVSATAKRDAPPSRTATSPPP